MIKLTELLTKYAASKLKFAERSRLEYLTTLNNLQAFLGREPTVDDLTDETLTAFLRHRLKSQSSHTVRKDRQQALCLWRFAWRKRLVEEQPRDIPEVPTTRKHIRAWWPDEVATILDACSKAATINGWGAPEFDALVRTIYDSAERIGALLCCPIAGFDPINRTLTIPAASRKGAIADQVATLHPETVEAIQRMLARRRSPRLVFEWHGHPDSLRRRFRKLLKRCGISTRDRKMFHDLRRTSYTLTYARFDRATAQQQCGHSQDLSRFYLDTSLLASLNPERRIAESIVRPIRKEAV